MFFCNWCRRDKSDKNRAPNDKGRKVCIQCVEARKAKSSEK